MGNPLSAPRDAGAQWHRLTAEIWNTVLDVLLPPRCLLCRDLVDVPRRLCPACWRGLEFIEQPCCVRCGLPFEHNMGHDALCGACMARPPAYARARAALRYEDTSRQLILAFKHGDRLEGTHSFARWMRQAGDEDFMAVDSVVPVPLHRWRLFRRRYNQAALLARAVASQAGLSYLPHALIRRKATRSQGGLSRSARRRNVAGAFAVPPKHRPLVENRIILLVDDVITTGATLDAAARTLRRAGAAEVRALGLARVVSPRQIPI